MQQPVDEVQNEYVQPEGGPRHEGIYVHQSRLHLSL